MLASDYEALYSCASDPLIWEQHPEPTRYQREVFEGFFQRAMDSRGALVAVDLQTQAILGTSRFYWLALEEREGGDRGQPQLSIGYTFLERKYWERGYNREMKRLMLEHAFRSQDHVIFQIGAQNLRSRRAVEKLGSKLIAQRELDGKSHVIYRIDRPADGPTDGWTARQDREKSPTLVSEGGA